MSETTVTRASVASEKRKSARRTMAVIAALSSTALVAGCATLPGSSSPQAIFSYNPQPTLENVPEPVPGTPSDLTLRDFLTASAHPANNHQAAKRFLSEGVQTRWEGRESTVILDRVDIASEGAASGDKIRYKVHGNIVGTLVAGGVFRPEYTAFETTYELSWTSGEWRISNLPNAVILDRQDFAANYEPHNIYFMDPQGKALVPDRRWVYNRQQSMASSLVSLLVAGPRQRLAHGVRNFLPEGATATVSEVKGASGINVDFSGLKDAPAASRRLLAAQVVWTLASSEIRGPFYLFSEGTPLIADPGEALSEGEANPGAGSTAARPRPLGPRRGQAGGSDSEGGQQLTLGASSAALNVADFSSFDPQAAVISPVRALSGGVLYQLDDRQAARESGWINSQYVESVAVSPQDTVFAAVRGRGDERRSLVVGPADAQPHTAFESDALTRPSWNADGTMLYTVSEGKDVIQFERNTVTGELVPFKVNMDSLKSIEGDDVRISVFRVARDGTHAVMIVNGRVYVAVMETVDGERRLGEPLPIGQQLGDTAISAEWSSTGSILVGTRANDAPVWQLEIDGSVANQRSGRNITAPVVAIASAGDDTYATDSRAFMQYNSADEESRFWREVPSMQGQRALPVLPY